MLWKRQPVIYKKSYESDKLFWQKFTLKFAVGVNFWKVYACI